MSVKVLTAPDRLAPEQWVQYPIRVFLAGGISNCPDWQQEIIAKIKQARDWKDGEILVINPRHPNFDKNAGQEVIVKQVEWEFYHLNTVANLHLFWFPKETVCPITLYELGRTTNDERAFMIGVEPEYMRRRTIEAQLSIVNADVPILNSLDDLVEELLLHVC